MILADKNAIEKKENISNQITKDLKIKKISKKRKKYLKVDVKRGRDRKLSKEQKKITNCTNRAVRDKNI